MTRGVKGVQAFHTSMRPPSAVRMLSWLQIKSCCLDAQSLSILEACIACRMSHLNTVNISESIGHRCVPVTCHNIHPSNPTHPFPKVCTNPTLQDKALASHRLDSSFGPPLSALWCHQQTRRGQLSLRELISLGKDSQGFFWHQGYIKQRRC